MRGIRDPVSPVHRASTMKIWKVLSLLLALVSYKSVPLAYYFRFYFYAFRNLIVRKRLSLCDPARSIFQSTTLHTFVSIFECDFYLHKSNSTYFSELDIARTDLMTTVFQKLFWHYQDNNVAKKGKGSIFNWPFVPVATVSATFLKELKPFQKYRIESRVFAWDEKWLFVLSKFISGKKSATICMTKYVLKSGRKTIRPREAMEVCGLYTVDAEEVNKQNYPMVQHYVDQGGIDRVEYKEV